MDNQHQILVVSPSATRSRDLRAWLTSSGYWVTVASTFAAAKLHLQSEPSVLITDLKLGEYNGLHLAVRAAASSVAVLILSEPNAAVEREAEKLGASYLSTAELTRERILAFVESHLPVCRPASQDDGGVEWTERVTSEAAKSVQFTTPGGDRRLN